MIAEDRATIVAWQLFGRQASIERFKSELERQTTPAWNRALAAIAGAIRDAETEARALATEAVEWRRQDESETGSLATWAEKAEALGYFPYICEECGGPALASHAGEECLGCGRHGPGESYAWSPQDLAKALDAELAVAEGDQGILHTAQVVTNVPNMLRSHPETTPGGVALRFYASIRMRVSRSGSLGPKGSEYGIKSTVKVLKNCLAQPWLEAEVDVEWGKGFNREGDVLDVATKAHVVIYDWLRHENPRALLADAMIATGRTGATVICVVNAADKEFKADLAEWARERGSTVSFDGSTTRVAPEKR